MSRRVLRLLRAFRKQKAKARKRADARVAEARARLDGGTWVEITAGAMAGTLYRVVADEAPEPQDKYVAVIGEAGQKFWIDLDSVKKPWEK